MKMSIIFHEKFELKEMKLNVKSNKIFSANSKCIKFHTL